MLAHAARARSAGAFMQPPARSKKVVRPLDLPRVLVFGTSVTCGVLAAMSVQILLGRAGIDLTAVWHNLFAAQALQSRSAAAVWLFAGAALVVSAIVAAALSRYSLPWVRFRLLRWLAGAAIVAGLAEIARSAGTASEGSAGTQLAVGLAAFALATVMAMLGAFFTVRR
jgi:hypothetical protein